MKPSNTLLYPFNQLHTAHIWGCNSASKASQPGLPCSSSTLHFHQIIKACCMLLLLMFAVAINRSKSSSLLKSFCMTNVYEEHKSATKHTFLLSDESFHCHWNSSSHSSHENIFPHTVPQSHGVSSTPHHSGTALKKGSRNCCEAYLQIQLFISIHEKKKKTLRIGFLTPTLDKNEFDLTPCIWAYVQRLNIPNTCKWAFYVSLDRSKNTLTKIPVHSILKPQKYIPNGCSQRCIFSQTSPCIV